MFICKILTGRKKKNKVDIHTNVWYIGGMVELTPKQKQVLDFIRQKSAQGIPPTIREIAAQFKVSSTGTVRDYLTALQKKGYLKINQKISRGIELLRHPLKIPILGNIPAGYPQDAFEDIQGYVDLEGIFPVERAGEGIFALRVKGESMVEAGIMDGDLAVIRRQSLAAEGEIVAAILEGNNEVTLKRLRRKGSQVFLEPANPHFAPIYADFNILGKLITILRKY